MKIPDSYEKYLLNSRQIMDQFINHRVILFGAGADGSNLYKQILHQADIAYFVDNGPVEGCTVYGKELKGFCELKQNYRGEIIIVASSKYCSEIILQLERHDFVAGKNFWIWNQCMDESSIDFGDDNVKKFIEYNKKIWNKPVCRNTKNKILMPYRSVAEVVYIPWSYCANILAEKYDADIYCTGGVGDVLDQDIWEIYKSFRVAGFIDETPDMDMQQEIQMILDSIWPDIHSRQDIKNISIFGENYGVEILRDYLRIEFPRLYLNDYNLKKHLRKMIGYVVFWHYYLKANANNIKAIIVWDGMYYREGIMRKIAYSYQIPVYSIVHSGCFRWEREISFSFEFYKKFFYMLDEKEQQEGIRWAEKNIEEHLNGRIDEMDMVHKSVFDAAYETDVLEKNNKIKVMICPHYMEDDPFPYGEMLFCDQWDWLEYLGEISNCSGYDWYLKPHPIEKALGDKLIDDYLEKYPNIKKLPRFISPVQLKKEGMRFALTIHGSIGFEYPLLGIQVINAGYNPHISFDFNINPENRADYMKILQNLQNFNTVNDINLNEILQFYCIHFGYYRHRQVDPRNILFRDWRLKNMRGLVGSRTKCSTELFRYYLEEVSENRHKDLLIYFRKLFEEMDHFRDGVFYKQPLPDSVV